MKDHSISFSFVGKKCEKKQKVLRRNENDGEETEQEQGKRREENQKKYNQIWEYEREKESFCMVIVIPGIALGFTAYLCLVRMHPLGSLDYSKTNPAIITA